MTHANNAGRAAGLLAARCLLLLLAHPPAPRLAGAQNVRANEVLPALGNATSTSRPSEATEETPRTESRLIVCPSEPPHSLARLLGVACDRSADCQFLGQDQRCCKKICRKGIEPDIYEPPHGELLGIRRKCPSYTFPERLPVKRCSKDEDCESINRICCPDKKDKLLYCRTAAPILAGLPFPDNISSLKTLVGISQCPPAPLFMVDVYSRSCKKTLDCFPNYCCQEGSRKICRPPKETILNFAFQATSRLFKG